MKITDIECLILDRSFPFVLVHTDEGLVGIGECFRRQPSVIKALIDDLLTPALIGKDPTETAVRFDDMQRAASAYEMGGAVWCAIAGLDIALWDIKGKALGQPIANLLGGMKRDKIRMYASSMRRDLTPLEEGQRAASFVEQGYSGYKLHSAVPGAIDDARDYTIATVTEVRAAVGDDIDILVDVNGAYSVHHAMEIGKALEQLGVFHFEEPRPHYDLEGLATIADALDIPIAAGEMIYTQYEYRDLILRGKVDIIQPDIVRLPCSANRPRTRRRTRRGNSWLLADFADGSGLHRVPEDRRAVQGVRQAHHRPQHAANPEHRSASAFLRRLCYSAPPMPT